MGRGQLNGFTSGVWTEDAVKTLRKLWGEGATAAAVAEAIPGATRNSVIGKVNRLGIQRYTAAPLTAQQRAGHRLDIDLPPKRKRAKAPAPPKPKAPKKQGFEFAKVSKITGLRMPGMTERRPPPGQPKSDAFAALPGTRPAEFGALGVCRWPIDGFDLPMCCGQSRKAGDESYCDTHRQASGSAPPQSIMRFARYVLRLAA